jgi:hypothetical protein
MKKYYLLLFFAVVLLGISFSGCKKDCELKPKWGYKIVGSDENCFYVPDDSGGDNGSGGNDGGGGNGDGGGGDEPPTMGTLKITNICSHPFKIYIDGAYKRTIAGGSYYTYSDYAGSYLVKVEQSSGHYQYPLIYDFYEYITAGYTTTVNIPAVTTGEIKIVSQSDNPYTLYINGSNQGTINGNSSRTIEVDAWQSYYVRVLQQSGYVLYPSEYTWTINVDANYRYTRTFPTKNDSNNQKIK